MNSDGVRNAAEPYVRILIRVPEAYFLIRLFDATRPGLLVLDADGRRVSTFALSGASVASTVAMLGSARRAAGTERILLRGEGLDALETRLRATDGVESVEASAHHLEIRARSGVLSPRALGALQSATKTRFTLVDPAPLAVRARKARRLDARGRIAGVWYRSDRDGTNTWVARFLAHPAPFTNLGLESGLTARRLEFEDLPQGGLAARILLEPYHHSGVVNVISHVSDDAIEVIGRVRKTDFKALREAMDARLQSLRDGPPAGG